MDDVNGQDPNTDAGQDPNTNTSESADSKEQDSQASGFDALPEATKAEIRKLRKENAAQRKTIEAAETERQKREASEAEKRGEWEKLATERQTEIDRLKGELAERDRADLRRTIAAKHKLPEDAVKYLTGDDEASIEDSAKDLARLTARSEDVDTDSGKPNAGGAAKQSTSVLANYEFGKRR